MACLERARAVGVEQILIPGLHPGQWSVGAALAATHGLLHGVGTHPHHLTTAGAASATPKDPGGAVAIGECGLDGAISVPMDVQIQVLEAHLALARDAGLPVILHCWRAHPQLLAVLGKWAPVRGVVHSYSGGADRVPAYLAFGLHLSFAGPLTWEGARKPVEALRRVPTDRLLLETDAPDQCPRPARGRNEPAFLPFVVEAAERFRGEPLREQLARNAQALGWA